MQHNYMFSTKASRYKILPSLNCKTDQRATKTAQAVYLMLITFLQEVMCMISAVMPAGWFQNYFLTHSKTKMAYAVI